MVTPKFKFDLPTIASITTIIVSICYGIKFGYNLMYAPQSNEASIKSLSDTVNEKFKSVDKQFEGVNGQLGDVKGQLGELRRMHLAVANVVETNSKTIKRNTIHIEENKTAIAAMPDKVITLLPEEVKKKIPR